MSSTAYALTGFICWALFLLVVMETIRSYLVVTGKAAPNGFTPDNSGLSPFMQRPRSRQLHRRFADFWRPICDCDHDITGGGYGPFGSLAIGCAHCTVNHPPLIYQFDWGKSSLRCLRRPDSHRHLLVSDAVGLKPRGCLDSKSPLDPKRTLLDRFSLH